MKAFGRNLARASLFIRRAAVIGITPQRVLLWELPRLICSRGFHRLTSSVYSLVDVFRLADKRTKRTLDLLPTSDSPYFYVIVVPRVIHFLVPAARLIEHEAKLCFILNGISSVEEDCLRKEFPDARAMRIWTLFKSPWPHGHLLSLLLRSSSRDFGILDHDFFLFDHSAFRQLAFSENEFAVSATEWKNSSTGRKFPGTHFLYLRASLIRKVMEKYRVGAQLYKAIPKNVAPMLEEMGLSLQNPPKEYQSFFDSFLMLSAIAEHDGLTARTLDIDQQGWEHVGGTSMGLSSTKDVSHHYVTCRFLGLLPYPKLSEQYRRAGLATADSAEQLRKALEPLIANRVDTLVNRIEAAG